MRCIAYCNAEYYNLKSLSLFFEGEGAKTRLYNKKVLHVASYKGEGDIFVFDYGCAVFWQYSEKLEISINSLLQRHALGRVLGADSEAFVVEPSKNGPSTMKNDIIFLAGDRILDKLSVSFALSQSVKLDFFEDILEKTIRETKKLPESLATHGKIPLSRRQISKKIGQLFLVRDSINLHTEMLGIPDFFWEHSSYEAFYKVIIKNLDVPQRVDLLNRRLDMIRDLFSMLGNELNHQHSNLLEWIIIILISVEIGLFLLKETKLFFLA